MKNLVLLYIIRSINSITSFNNKITTECYKHGGYLA